MSNEMLSKVIGTTELTTNGQGLLPPEQTDQLLDYVFDATVLGREARVIRMRSNEIELDKVGIGERLLRVATEAVDDGMNVGVAFSKISLTTRKFRLDWELSSEALEDGLEGDALEDRIARMIATQVGQDMEDLAINGDTELETDPLFKGFNGWREIAESRGVVLDAGVGNNADRALFGRMIKAMPRKFMQARGQLKFYADSNVIQDYLFSLENMTNNPEPIVLNQVQNGDVVANGPAGYVAGRVYGINLQEVPMFRTDGVTGSAELTFPQNRIWGVRREIQVFREFKPKKDAIEYTLYTRVGAAVENPAAYVVMRNIPLLAE